MSNRKSFFNLVIFISIFSNVYLRSRYYGPNGENYYITDESNVCLNVEKKYTEEEQIAKSEEFRQNCYNANSKCFFIEGKKFLSDGSTKTVYDCYYDRFDDYPIELRDFWNTNPQEFGKEDFYQVCKFRSKITSEISYPCDGRSKFFNEDGTSNYPEEDNPCLETQLRYDPDEVNPVILKNQCLDTQTSTGRCVFITGQFVSSSEMDYDCVWNKENENYYQIRVIYNI